MITILDLIEKMTDQLVDDTTFDEIEQFYFNAQYERYEALPRELLLAEANSMGFNMDEIEE